MAAIKLIFSALVLGLSTLVHCAFMTPVAVIKLMMLRITPVRRMCDACLAAIARSWVSSNRLWFDAVNSTRWTVTGLEGLQSDNWYLLVSNHQSWMDILALQRTFNGRIPLLKFFIKKELIYVPFIGLAWWALDFPFMRRKGGQSARKDLEDARRACEKFRLMPTTVMSFVEGTRFTAEKHAQQSSPYRHLLHPKSGGITMALETLSDKFTAVLDVDIAYPQGVPTFQDALCGRVREVVIHVHQRPVPEALRPNARGQINRKAAQPWLDGLWLEKDAALDQLLPANDGPDESSPPR